METGAMSVREETDKTGFKILVMCVRNYVKNADDVEDRKKCMVFLYFTCMLEKFFNSTICKHLSVCTYI